MQSQKMQSRCQRLSITSLVLSILVAMAMHDGAFADELPAKGPAGASGQRESASFTYYADTTDSYTKGDLQSATNSAGEVTQFLEHTWGGWPKKIKHANGQTVSLVYYGPRNSLMSSTVEDRRGISRTTTFSYDRVGQLTGAVSPGGAAMSYLYDNAHRLTGIRDNAGNAVHFTLDGMGNVLKQEVRGVSGELVRQSIHTFDALNRRERDQHGQEDPGTSYKYDRGGNLTAIIDPLGRVTTREYDNFNRLIREVLPRPPQSLTDPSIGYAYAGLFLRRERQQQHRPRHIDHLSERQPHRYCLRRQRAHLRTHTHGARCRRPGRAADGHRLLPVWSCPELDLGQQRPGKLKYFQKCRR